MNKERLEIAKEQKKEAVNNEKIVHKNGKVRNTGIRRKKGTL